MTNRQLEYKLHLMAVIDGIVFDELDGLPNELTDEDIENMLEEMKDKFTRRKKCPVCGRTDKQAEAIDHQCCRDAGKDNQ